MRLFRVTKKSALHVRYFSMRAHRIETVMAMYRPCRKWDVTVEEVVCGNQ